MTPGKVKGREERRLTSDLSPAEFGPHENPTEEHARWDGPCVEEHAGEEVGVLRKEKEMDEGQPEPS